MTVVLVAVLIIHLQLVARGHRAQNIGRSGPQCGQIAKSGRFGLDGVSGGASARVQMTTAGNGRAERRLARDSAE